MSAIVLPEQETDRNAAGEMLSAQEKATGATASRSTFRTASRLRALALPIGALSAFLLIAAAHADSPLQGDLSPAAEVSFNPVHDGRVESANPTTSFGTGTGTRVLLRVRTNPEIDSYVKFNVSGLGGAVAGARLRLYCIDTSSDGGRVYSVANDYRDTTTPWIETGLNWNNAPTISGPILDQKGAVSANTWVEFDVTPAIAGDGTYSFALSSNVTNIAGYESKEASHPPELVIQVGAGSPPTITGFTPASGPVGTQVTVTGTNFGTATAVAFNGVPAQFTIDSDAQLRATAPAGAAPGFVDDPGPVLNATGPISVTNPSGTAFSTELFTVEGYSLAITVVGSGTVTPTPDQPTYEHGTSVSLAATPDAGWSFVGWSGHATGSANPLNLLMDGNKSVTATFASSPPPPSGATFTPIHDARVQSDAPTTNYGTGTGTRILLRVRSTGPSIASYLKFDVTGISGAVTSAKLRLFCIDASSDGGRVYSVSNHYAGTSTPWVETGLIWNNAPALSGAIVDQKGAVPANAYVEFDVTQAVTGNGTYSFGLTSNSTNIAGYNSKELANPPQLVLNVGTEAVAAAERTVEDAEAHREQLPKRVSLRPAAPNPFRDRTTFRIELPHPDHVRLFVFDLHGRRVRTLVDGLLEGRSHDVSWDSRDESGTRVPAGIYWIQLETTAVTLRRKVALVP